MDSARLGIDERQVRARAGRPVLKRSLRVTEKLQDFPCLSDLNGDRMTRFSIRKRLLRRQAEQERARDG